MKKFLVLMCAVAVIVMAAVVFRHVANRTGETGTKKVRVLPKSKTATATLLPGITTNVPAKVRSPRPAWQAPTPQIGLIAGFDKNADYQKRLEAVHDLGNLLSKAEIEGIYLIMETRNEEQTDLSQTAFNAIRNDLVEVLFRQESQPVDLGARLMGMIAETELDDGWRGYCVQFLPAYYEKRWPDANGSSNDKERADVEAVLWRSLDDQSVAIAGAGLLAMNRIVNRSGGVDKGRLSAKALQLVKDGNQVQIRVTAMLVCGDLGIREALPAARVAAQTGAVVPLRMAAVGVLGQVGSAEDMELLESLAAGSDPHVKIAALHSLKTLKARLEPVRK